MSVVAKVRRFIRQHDLWPSGARVVCALSGGSDSVALAHVLTDLDARGELQCVGLAHLNHQLRATADRDEQFCRDLAAQLQRPLLVEREDVPARAVQEHASVELAAHRARYALFARARAQFAADRVAVGHTRDDQAETFLLRLLRGAGPRGLAGMYPRHDDVVRPLLACSRAELREFLRARHQPFVEDETNADVSVPRNRVRAELVPYLADHFNPNIVDVLAREADLARDVWSWLEAELEAFADPARERALEVDRLRAAPLALQRLAMWRLLAAGAPTDSVATSHVDAALGLLTARDGACIDAPGVRVHRMASRIVLTTARDDRPNLWRFPLSIPGEVVAGGIAVSAELALDGTAALQARANVGRGPVAAVRGDRFERGLAVRNRRPGDRFTPVGLGGRRKLQDVFVDRKIARRDRDAVPIVVDDQDRIVWVAGHGIDEAFRVTDASQKVVVLTLRYLGPAAAQSRGGDPLERRS